MSNQFAKQNSLQWALERKNCGAVRAAVWGMRGMPTARALPVAQRLESRQLLSATWFVSPSGGPDAAGTFADPFSTIQAAANVAQAGDRVEIEAGTYRETVVPAHSGAAGAPIVFEAYNGQKVTINGANPVGDWSAYSGHIYQGQMPWDLGEGSNEVFVDGQAINEARFPNTSLDLSHPTMETADSAHVSGNVATIYDASLNQSADYWKGALIHITAGQQWDAQTGAVLSSAPGQITVSCVPNNPYEIAEAGDPFYLTGTFKALNGAGEWYRDPTTRALYVWTPGGDSPANHTIEVKARANALDLSGKSYITVRGINIFAATIKTDGHSAHTVLDGINATYISQFFTMATGWVTPNNAGIMLNGANSLLENSTIAFSAGDGVYVSGTGSRVTNNVIHDVDYVGGDAAGIRCYGASSQLDHNTIYNTGRDGILHEATGLKILYNDISSFGLQTTDCGGIYTVRTDGGGSILAYNTVHNAHTAGFGATGIYLDNDSSNFVVHHNRTWDVETGIKLNFSSEGHSIYNNTFDATRHAVYGNFVGDWNQTSFSNNVFLQAAQFGKGAALSSNSTDTRSGDGAGVFASGATLIPPTGAGTSSNTDGSGAAGTTSTGAGGTTFTSGTQPPSGTGGSSTGAGGTTPTSGAKPPSGAGGSPTGASGTGSTSTGTGGTTPTSGAKPPSGAGAGGSSNGAGGTGSTSTGTGGTTSTSGAKPPSGAGGSSTGASGTGTTSTGAGSTTPTSGAQQPSGAGGSSTGASDTGSASTGGSGDSAGTGQNPPGAAGAAGNSAGSGATSPGSVGSSTTSASGSETGGASNAGGASGAPVAPVSDAGGGNEGASAGPAAPASGAGGNSAEAGNGLPLPAGATAGGSDAAAPAAPSTTAAAPPVIPTTPASAAADAPAAHASRAELLAAVSDNRDALLNNLAQRHATIRELAETRRANLRAYAVAKRRLASAKNHRPLVGSNRHQADQASVLAEQVKQLRQAVRANAAALATARESDFTGVRAARQSLAQAVRSWRAAAGGAKTS